MAGSGLVFHLILLSAFRQGQQLTLTEQGLPAVSPLSREVMPVSAGEQSGLGGVG